jgi:hypothetical protein
VSERGGKEVIALRLGVCNASQGFPVALPGNESKTLFEFSFIFARRVIGTMFTRL